MLQEVALVNVRMALVDRTVCKLLNVRRLMMEQLAKMVEMLEDFKEIANVNVLLVSMGIIVN
ncbi:MAG: hypothetical protein QF535_06740 [Anaerolineales bacterium]|nr:hypothetical protein [Anaerolineales bacterium]